MHKNATQTKRNLLRQRLRPRIWRGHDYDKFIQ